MIRVKLPYHLRTLAKTEREIELSVNAPVTIRSILDVLEAQYPMLRGTIRDSQTRQRRSFIRFFACGEDMSHFSEDTSLPVEVADGRQEFMIVGAMAGG